MKTTKTGLMRSKLGILGLLSALFCISVLVLSCFFHFFSVFSVHFQDASDNILRFDRFMPIEFCGIAADDEENCYIAFDTSVFVYDKHGQYLHRYTKPFRGSSFDFSIEENELCFWYARSDLVYTYSKDGKLQRVKEYTYEDAPQYKNFLEQRKYMVNGKLKYRYHSVFGFWWITNAEDHLIVHIPVLAYFVKLSLCGILVCSFLFIGALFKGFILTKTKP